MSIFALKGIDEIARYTGFNLANIMDFIVNCKFPAEQVDGVWVAKKANIKIWLKWFDPQKPVDHLTIRPKKNLKKRRW